MLRKSLVALSIGLGLAASAHADMIGQANGYNVFVFGVGNFAGSNSDTGGNIAVGGDVSLMNYSVASGIAGNPGVDPNPARLVVGGDLSATNGGVGNGQNGALYVGGSASTTSFTATGGLFAQTLVDFGSAQAAYQSLSQQWGSLAPTGAVSVSGTTLSLSGTDSTLNVFSVSASTLTGSNTVNISAPTNSTVLINVTGDNAVFQNGQVFLTGVGAAYVMYNFVDATSVTLAGSKDPMGSILAPLAGVQGTYGQMNGQLITGSFTGIGSDMYGHTEFHNTLFEGTIPVVPLPAAVWFLLSGLVGLGGLTLRRAHVMAP